MKIHSVIYFLTTFAVLVPFTICLKYFKRYARAYRFLSGVVFTGVAIEIFKELHDRTPWATFDLNMYTFFETFFIAMVYHELLSSKWKKGVKVSTLALMTFFLIDLLWIEGPFTMNSISLNLECTLFIILSVKLYHSLIVDVPSHSLWKMPEFWFNNAVFLYFSTTFFVFPFGKELFNNPDGHFYGFHLWDINDIVNIFFNVFFAISLWFAKEKREWTPASS